MPANITDVFFVNKVRITCSFDNEGARDIVIISVFGAYLDSRKFRKSYRYVRNGHGVYKYVYRVIVSRVSFVFRIVTRGTNVSHFPLHRSSVFKYNKKLFSSFVNLLQPFNRPFESRSFLFPFPYFNKIFFLVPDQ